MEKVNKKIQEPESKFKFSKVQTSSKGSKGDSLIKHLPRTICHVSYWESYYTYIQKYYVQFLLKESVLNAASNTHQQVNDTLHNIFQEQNNILESMFRLQNNDEEINFLSCNYWYSKMHKIPSGARFIITGEKCYNKQLSKHVTLAFKLWYSQIDAYHRKTFY